MWLMVIVMMKFSSSTEMEEPFLAKSLKVKIGMEASSRRGLGRNREIYDQSTMELSLHANLTRVSEGFIEHTKLMVQMVIIKECGNNALMELAI